MDTTTQTTVTPFLEVSSLRARLTGDVFVPGDAEWDEARQAWNLAVDQQPAAVALPETAADVAAIVAFARAHGLRVAPQGTGHNAPPLGLMADTILVKTHRMRAVSIDPESRTARVEAGVLWLEVVTAAAEHGLAALAGSSPDVGVVGYSLGGGISWLARKHGLSANSVTAVEIVTADGRIVRADSEHEPELFWAVRGGGGNFGIVTALELKLFPIEEVYAGILFFPIERSAEILEAWGRWIEGVPEEVTSVGRILQLPPIPDIPEPFRGRSFVVVEAIMLLEESEGAELLRPLRELGPEIDTVATIPVSALSFLHMDPEQPVPGAGDGMLLTDFTPETVAAIVEAAGPASGSPLISVEVRHLGGALARTAPHHGAIATIDAPFVMFAVGITPTPEIHAAVETHVRHVQSALAPWDAGKAYLNFTERKADSRIFYREEAYRRLRKAKALYDPSEVFKANHQIPPAELRRARKTRVSPPPARPVRPRREKS
jgi:FAD/FMN-containing dehydrogenase